MHVKIELVFPPPSIKFWHRTYCIRMIDLLAPEFRLIKCNHVRLLRRVQLQPIKEPQMQWLRLRRSRSCRIGSKRNESESEDLARSSRSWGDRNYPEKKKGPVSGRVDSTCRTDWMGRGAAHDPSCWVCFGEHVGRPPRSTTRLRNETGSAKRGCVGALIGFQHILAAQAFEAPHNNFNDPAYICTTNVVAIPNLDNIYMFIIVHFATCSHRLPFSWLWILLR